MRHTRARLASSAILLTLAASLAPTNCFSFDTERFAGDWVGFEFTGSGEWDNGSCVLIWFQERRYKFDPVGTTSRRLTGTYISRLHGRFLRNDRGHCKYPSQSPPQPAFSSTRVWSAVAAVENSSDATVTASFDRCFDSACNDEKLSGSKADFTTSVVLVSEDELQDRPSGTSESDSMRLFREDVGKKVTDSAITGLDSFIAAVESGRFREGPELFLDSSFTSDARDKFLASTSMLHDMFKGISSRSIIEARYVNRIRQNGVPSRVGQFAFVARQTFKSGGGYGMESAVLHQENGRWKLMSFYYMF